METRWRNEGVWFHMDSLDDLMNAQTYRTSKSKTLDELRK